MPYITQRRRRALDPLFNELDHQINNAGELNYAITRLVQSYVTQPYPAGALSYTGINSAIGALECAKQELYRRVAAPYEDDKIAENGDVFEEPLVDVPDDFATDLADMAMVQWNLTALDAANWCSMVRSMNIEDDMRKYLESALS